MQLVNKNILLISPEPWNHIFVSKHHYATHLAVRGNKVYFLNPPSKISGCTETEYESVFSVNYKGFIRGLRFFPTFLQRCFIRKKFEQLQKLCQVKFDIVWSFDNSVFFDFSALPKEVYSISHIVDLNQDFEFENAAKTADICFGVCQPILKKLLKCNVDSYFINHGFNNPPEDVNKVILPGENKIKAFYGGNLDIKYLDWGLIEKLIDYFKHVDFIFAGPWKNIEIKNKYLRKENFFYLGVINSNEIKKFYSFSDILLILYLYKEFKDQLSNTHKMMEYLGSGKVITATWIEEYSRLVESGLIKMSQTHEQFMENFNEVKNNLDYWNSEELASKREAYALNNTYAKQIEKIEQLLSQVQNLKQT